MKIYRFFLVLFLLAVTAYAQTAPPTNLTATVGNSTMMPGVTLAWEYGTSTTPVKFNIYKKTGAINDTTFHFVRVYTTSLKTWVDHSVQIGKKYSYYVTAVIGTSQSNPSNMVEVQITAPVIAYGKISGTVFNDSTSAPIRNTYIEFIAKQGSTAAGFHTYTDSLGFFTAKLKTGQYYMYFNARTYYIEYYNNVSTFQNATAVTLNENDSLVYNIGLKPFVVPVLTYGKVSGKLFTDGTNAPVKFGQVKFIPKNNNTSTPICGAVTDTNGNFSARIKTGEYYMFFSARGFVSEYFDNVSSLTNATSIVVANGDSLVYNVGLAPVVPPVTYTVSGSVLDEGGLPVRAELSAFSVTNPHCPSIGGYHARTDSLGNFFFTVRENDTIKIYIAPMLHTLKPQYYNNKATFNEADLVPVTGNVTGINVTMHPFPVYANGVSGTVKDSAGTTVVSRGLVYIFKKTNGMLTGKKFAKVDTLTGAYSFANLEPGLYILYAQGMGYKPTYFKYDGTPTLNWRLADSVVVTATSLVTDINFNLRTYQPHHGPAIVFGNVAGEKNVLVDGAMNYLVDENGDFVDYAISDLDGSYVISNVDAASYTLVSSLPGYNDSKIGLIITEQSTFNEANIDLTPETVTSVNDNVVVSEYALQQNYPNPFNPTTIINYQIPQNGVVTLKVYNILGKEVATLVNEQQTAGKHYVTFNASNLASGVYFYRLESGSFTSVKKLTLIK